MNLRRFTIGFPNVPNHFQRFTNHFFHHKIAHGVFTKLAGNIFIYIFGRFPNAVVRIFRMTTVNNVTSIRKTQVLKIFYFPVFPKTIFEHSVLRNVFFYSRASNLVYFICTPISAGTHKAKQTFHSFFRIWSIVSAHLGNGFEKFVKLILIISAFFGKMLESFFKFVSITHRIKYMPQFFFFIRRQFLCVFKFLNFCNKRMMSFQTGKFSGTKIPLILFGI